MSVGDFSNMSYSAWLNQMITTPAPANGMTRTTWSPTWPPKSPAPPTATFQPTA